MIEISPLLQGTPGCDTGSYRYFLLDVQAHCTGVSGVALPAELVEGGQLLMMELAR